MYKNRLIIEQLKSLSGAFPVVVITGARQVGKTTLLHELYGSEFDYVVFDPVVDVENARAEPDFFLRNHSRPLILDEVQYVPELISALKRAVDKDRKPGQYFLTGSQQWEVMKSMSESLAGRAAFIDLGGYSFSEIGGYPEYEPWLPKWLSSNEYFWDYDWELVEEFSTYEQLWRGWMPQAQEVSIDVIPQFHQGYQRTYIERDIRLMADVSDWQLFGRFVQLLAALSAQEINYSQLGRELGISPKTAERWLSLLKATFQWFEIPVYSKNAVKRITQKPKGYMSDTGAICSLQAISQPQVVGGHPLWGAIFETGVVGELRKQANAMVPAVNFYHWRSHGGAEVDIVLELDGVLFPIEIKATANPSRSDTSGITRFRKDYAKQKVAPGLVICNCEKPLPLNERDYALPWNYVLKKK